MTTFKFTTVEKSSAVFINEKNNGSPKKLVVEGEKAFIEKFRETLINPLKSIIRKDQCEILLKDDAYGIKQLSNWSSLIMMNTDEINPQIYACMFFDIQYGKFIVKFMFTLNGGDGKNAFGELLKEAHKRYGAFTKLTVEFNPGNSSLYDVLYFKDENGETKGVGKFIETSIKSTDVIIKTMEIVNPIKKEIQGYEHPKYNAKYFENYQQFTCLPDISDQNYEFVRGYGRAFHRREKLAPIVYLKDNKPSYVIIDVDTYGRDELWKAMQFSIEILQRGDPSDKYSSALVFPKEKKLGEQDDTEMMYDLIMKDMMTLCGKKMKYIASGGVMIDLREKTAGNTMGFVLMDGPKIRMSFTLFSGGGFNLMRKLNYVWNLDIWGGENGQKITTEIDNEKLAKFAQTSLGDVKK
jgi:hypothetical protein